MSSNLRGALFALAAFGLFSTADAMVKILGGYYAPVQVLFFTVMFSFPLATLMLIRDQRPATLVPVHPWWVAMRTLAAVWSGLAGFYAFSVLPLAQVYAILFAMPMLITMLAIPILGERVGPRRWMAILVGLAGVLVVLRPGSSAFTLGHLAAVSAAFTNAFVAIAVRKIGADERPVVLILYPLVANFVLMGAALSFVYEPMPIEHIGLVAGLSLLGFVAQWVMIAAYNAGEAAVVAPMQYSQMIWATAFGMMFFDEFIDLWTGLGSTIIAASGLYIVLRETRPSASATRPVLRSRGLRTVTAATFRLVPLRRRDPGRPDD